MLIKVIGSGSKGNCVFIESSKAKILIDCGLSFKHVKDELKKDDLTLDNLDAIFITHEHKDHIGHLGMFLKKTDATLYMERHSFLETSKFIEDYLKYDQINFLQNHTKYQIKDLLIVPILMSHDSVNCFGFLVKEGANTYAHITDTGIIYEQYYDILSKVDCLLIESNHDVSLLKNSARPDYLIERILSNRGHLSNAECNIYLNNIVKFNEECKIKTVILAHLSEECNLETIARSEVENTFETLPFELLIAKQRESLKAIEVKHD